MRFTIDDNDLLPLIERTVAAAMERLESISEKLNGRLAYPEPEAAALLGIRPHVLRDARLRGTVKATRVGKRVLYARDDLLRLLRDNQLVTTNPRESR